MTNFLNNLYEMDNIILILTCVLVGLIILFVIILIFGKKDQKLEETKRLQKITEESFKEEKTEPVKLEVEEEEIKLPELKEDTVEVKEFVPEEPKVEIKQEVMPLIDDVKEDLEIPEIKFDEEALANDLKELEDIKNKFNEIDIPKVEVKTEENKPQVFSSVYVAKQDNSESNNKEVSVTQENTKDQMLFMEDDEDTMELPSLKTEESKSPLEDISGETYNL